MSLRMYTKVFVENNNSNILSIWFRERTFLNMCVERGGRQKEGERADKTNGVNYKQLMYLGTRYTGVSCTETSLQVWSYNKIAAKKII